MENKKTKTIKQGLLAIAIPVIVFFILLWFAGGVAANEQYDPLVPDAQATYDYALKAFESAERNLVNAKLMDNAHGVLELTPDQLKKLQEKKLGLK